MATRMLSVFLAHNYYRSSSPSGENVAFEAEAQLLSDNGHSVNKYVRHSDEIAGYSSAKLAMLAGRVIWSATSFADIKKRLSELRPDVAHFHNTFPLISASAFRACQEIGVPVVHTLHNYRPLCLNALFLRNGHICESCLPRRLAWPGVLRRCYRGSLAYSGTMALMQVAQRVSAIGWEDVDVFVAPSEFLRQRYIAAGFPADRIRVKPNFAEIESPESRANEQGRGYALFVGRLSAEKGVRTLLATWKRLPHVPLILVGDGPEGRELRVAAENLKNVTFVGALPRPDVLGYLRHASFLIVPSECYESFSMVTLEAFANRIPVIASALGALPELVVDGKSGLLFRAKDVDDLARQAGYLWSHPASAAALGTTARLQYEERFTPEQNYSQLLGIYQLANRLHHIRSGRTTAPSPEPPLTPVD